MWTYFRSNYNNFLAYIMKNIYHDGVTQQASLGYHLHQHFRKEDLPLKLFSLPLLYRYFTSATGGFGAGVTVRY